MVIITTAEADLQMLWPVGSLDKQKCTINRKTKIIKFRREGRIAEERGIHCDGKKLESVSSFKYFGITLQTTEAALSVHYQMMLSGYKAMSDAHNLEKLSLNTTLKLFKLRVM
jgi:hypothetical protein